MFWLETDLSGVSITRMGVEEGTKGRTCIFMYAVYKRECPLPAVEDVAHNLTLWTKPFFTYSNGLARLRLWESDVIYRLPRIALDTLMEGDDLCAAPVRVELRHTPYSGFAVDGYNRGSADGKSAEVTTALHIGSYTPCIVAPRDTLLCWLRFLKDTEYLTLSVPISAKKRGLGLSWLEPLLCTGDVRVDHIPCLLDSPVRLIGEKVSRETA